jgi:transcriptional regulator GlxA family with amidase domain
LLTPSKCALLLVDVRRPTGTPPEVARWRGEWHQIVAAHERNSPADTALARLALLAVLRFMLEAGSTARLESNVAVQLRALIDDDVQCQITLADLSRRCGYTPHHVRARFRAYYGISPHQYRAQSRLNRATSLITDTQLSCKEIAARVGFDSATAFTADFRQRTGMPPSEARHRFRLG